MKSCVPSESSFSSSNLLFWAYYYFLAFSVNKDDIFSGVILPDFYSVLCIGVFFVGFWKNPSRENQVSLRPPDLEAELKMHLVQTEHFDIFGWIHGVLCLQYQDNLKKQYVTGKVFPNFSK